MPNLSKLAASVIVATLGSGVGCAQLPSTVTAPHATPAQPAQTAAMAQRSVQYFIPVVTGGADATTYDSGNTYQTYIDRFSSFNDLKTKQISKDNGNASATSGRNDPDYYNSVYTGYARAQALGSGNTWQVWDQNNSRSHNTDNLQDSQHNGNASADTGNNN